MTGFDSRPPLHLHTIGTAVPETFLTSEVASQVLLDGCPSERSRKLMQRILRLTAIEKRHLAALAFQDKGDAGASLYQPSESQPRGPGMKVRNRMFMDAATPLIRRAMAPLDREQLRRLHTLVTVTCTHAGSPGLEYPVFAAAEIPAAVERWNIGFMGCSAALSGIRLLHAAAPAGPSLMLACELSSLHFQYTDQIDQMTANLLFADGTAAVLMSPEPSDVRVIGAACASLPAAADQMVWEACDTGLELQLSQALPDTLAGALPGAVGAFLDRHGLGRDDIDHWLVHPGGPQVLDAVEKCLELADGSLRVSREILRNYGNMSSPTIMFILKAWMETGAAGRVMLVAFGPGLTIEMVLVEVARRN